MRMKYTSENRVKPVQKAYGDKSSWPSLLQNIPTLCTTFILNKKFKAQSAFCIEFRVWGFSLRVW